ncbi:uncharacterized protein LOC132797187 isoform X1 [Drosophila nasuta]|uniref:uncharacterized protein LOC132797187 isoform X1 n=1 Tax=Drosophila nasuta TaxID=42062 RepID=UPI00295F12FA|nr:uncharacterized protein LOC132797187 isoform X1 [Drosophila nasuta]
MYLYLIKRQALAIAIRKQLTTNQGRDEESAVVHLLAAGACGRVLDCRLPRRLFLHLDVSVVAMLRLLSECGRLLSEVRSVSRVLLCRHVKLPIVVLSASIDGLPQGIKHTHTYTHTHTQTEVKVHLHRSGRQSANRLAVAITRNGL